MLRWKDKIFNIREAAEYTDRSIDNLRRLSQQGKIPCFKKGGKWRFWRSDLDLWMEDSPKHNYKVDIKIDDLDDDLTHQEIADKFGVTRELISYYAKKFGKSRGGHG